MKKGYFNHKYIYIYIYTYIYIYIHICIYIWAILEGVVQGFIVFLSSVVFTNYLRKTIYTSFERALIEESKTSQMDVLSHILLEEWVKECGVVRIAVKKTEYLKKFSMDLEDIFRGNRLYIQESILKYLASYPPSFAPMRQFFFKISNFSEKN